MEVMNVKPMIFLCWIFDIFWKTIWNKISYCIFPVFWNQFNFFLKITTSTCNMKVFSKVFLPSYFEYCWIWLNIHVDDHFWTITSQFWKNKTICATKPTECDIVIFIVKEYKAWEITYWCRDDSYKGMKHFNLCMAQYNS